MTLIATAVLVAALTTSVMGWRWVVESLPYADVRDMPRPVRAASEAGLVLAIIAPFVAYYLIAPNWFRAALAWLHF